MEMSDRAMYPTLRLAYALQRAYHADGFGERQSVTPGGMLLPDTDQMTMEELGIRNADECRFSLTCDM